MAKVNSWYNLMFPLNEYHMNSAEDGEIILDSNTGHVTIYNAELHKFLSKTKELEAKINGYNDIKNDLTKQFLDIAEDIEYLVKEYHKFIKQTKLMIQECEELKHQLDNLKIIIFNYLSKIDGYYLRLHDYLYKNMKPYIDAIVANLREILKLRANIEELEFLLKDAENLRDSNATARANLPNITYIGPPSDSGPNTINPPSPPPTPPDTSTPPTDDTNVTASNLKDIEIRLTANQPIGIKVSFYPGGNTKHVSIGKINHPSWGDENNQQDTYSFGSFKASIIGNKSSTAIIKLDNYDTIRTNSKFRYTNMFFYKLENPSTGLVGDSGIELISVTQEYLFNNQSKKTVTITGDSNGPNYFFYRPVDYSSFSYDGSYDTMSTLRTKLYYNLNGGPTSDRY